MKYTGELWRKDSQGNKATQPVEITVEEEPVEPLPPNPVSTLGFYPGSFGTWDPIIINGTPVSRFERAEGPTQLNREIKWTTVMLDQGGAEGDPRKMVASAHFLVNKDRLWKFRSRIIPVVSCPIAWIGTAAGTRDKKIALQKTAHGDWDDKFLQVATMSESGRHVNQYVRKYVRVGWELNGNWPDWSSRDGRHEEFKQAFRRVANIFRAEGWGIVWCVMASQWEQGFGPEAFPGSDIVDVVNIDVYRRAQSRPSMTNLRNITDWAKEKGCKVGFAEWGLGEDTPGTDQGVIVDDGVFVTEMAAFFNSLGSQLLWQMIFSPNGERDVLDKQTLPKVNAAWRTAFGR